MKNVETFSMEDSNVQEKFIFKETIKVCRTLRILMRKFYDLYGRVIIYDMKVKGKDTSPKAIITDVSSMESMLSRIDNKELVQMYKQQFKQNMIDCGFKPGDIVSIAVLDKLKEQGINIPYKTGGDALEYLLKKIDPDKELDKARKELDKAKGKDIDKAYKKVRALEMIKKNNLKPEDLMVKYVPVAPSYLRPIIPQEERRDVLVNDMNKLYGQILTANTIQL